MSNLWRLKQNLSFDPTSVAWPAELEADLTLDPADFFERKTVQDGMTSIAGETQFDIDFDRAKILITTTGIAPPLKLHITLDKGYAEVDGNNLKINAQVTSLDHAAALIDQVKVMFCQFLSIELGVFCDVRSITGNISGRDFKVTYPGLAYSILVNEYSPAERGSVIAGAVNLVNVGSPSYLRYVTCCLYYQHALRFLSPYEVSFSEFVALPEIILNLSKCIELLFPSGSRDELKKSLLKTGYSEEQISSQLISIIILRNQFDVGHITSGGVTAEEIEILRQFCNRSVGNVRALLKSVAVKIGENQNFLQPLSKIMSSDNKKRLEQLEIHLSKPSLESENQKQIFITARVS